MADEAGPTHGKGTRETDGNRSRGTRTWIQNNGTAGDAVICSRRPVFVSRKPCPYDICLFKPLRLQRISTVLLSTLPRPPPAPSFLLLAIITASTAALADDDVSSSCISHGLSHRFPNLSYRHHSVLKTCVTQRLLHRSP